MNNRQNEILNYLITNDSFINSKELSSIFSISLRTAQLDLKKIIAYMNENNISYSYDKNLGYKVIKNNDYHLLSSQNLDIQTNLRSKYILRVLLFSKSFIKLDQLTSDLYISSTTLNSDIKNVKKILNKYHLNLISKPYYGSTVEGEEKNKRICIINEKLIAFHDNNLFYNPQLLSEINKIVSNSLISNKFSISDSDFQNFLLATYLCISRVMSGYHLTEYLENFNFDNSYFIVKEILEKLANYFNFQIQDSEIKYLSSFLYGKNSIITQEIIPNNIEQHVTNILEAIKKKLDVDLTYSIELRVALSLHLIPLFERIQANNQIKEIPTLNIHNAYSYSFELAIITAQYIKEKTNTVLSEAELAYLAIHYAVIFEKDGDARTKKSNILFICSSRRSDSLLIKSVIYNHFPSKINQIDVKNVYELNGLDVTKYDIVFSTILNNKLVPRNAIKINHFLTETDFHAIEFALTNGSIFKMIESLFSKDRFITHFKADNKREVIKKLAAISNKFIEEKTLFAAIMNRENNGFTSYGNLIALPHPEHLLSNISFCSVVLLDKPIIWSENNYAQIIILCCASKASSKDLQVLFNFISLLFNNQQAVNQIIQTQTYEKFIESLENLQHSNIIY